MQTRKMIPIDLYEKIKSEPYISLCGYCGQTAEEVDHIYNKSNYSKPSQTGKSWWRGPLTDCCGACNRLIGGRDLPDPQARSAYVAEQLSLALVKLEQESPSWSEAELSELGEGLKAHIVAHESVKEKLRDRIHWATRASRRACIWVHAVEIESDGEFAVLDESDDVEAGSRPNSWLSDADISRA